jgi:hypothetical protein
MSSVQGWALARTIALLAAVSISLAACGDDDPFASYCKEVKAQQAALSEDLAGGETTGLIDALPEFEQLSEKSPDDLQDEWHTVTSRIGALVDALEDAGVDPATYDRRKPPSGLTDDQRQAIDAAAKGLATAEMAQALAGVEQQARDVCQTPLTL